MKLDVRGFALTFGVVWGGAMLLVGVANSIGGGYAKAVFSVAPAGALSGENRLKHNFTRPLRHDPPGEISLHEPAEQL